MSNILKRSASKIAIAAIGLTLIVPAAAAMAATPPLAPSFNHGTSPKSFTQGYVWSRYEHYTKKHGSSAQGDVGGLKRSACVQPGQRAYAESVYSIWGGSKHAYYRTC
ncbi:lactococcin 972 family bacteriocin [Paeniglutamicibacter sp. R2-26]|uniref:lactococcin 972 family bacteriocin n=1 Tax=Paeniglutamicibacter sp. R2-26 TaxID=3144417 RepID=UPI003EE69252